MSNPVTNMTTPIAGVKPDDTMSVGTEAVDSKSVISGTKSTVSSKSTIEKLLRKLDYKSVLHLIREVEEQINNYSEVYTKMIELGKSNMKVDMEFKEVLRQAEQDRKLKKYFE